MIKVVSRSFSNVVRKPCDEQAAIKAARSRHANGSAVQLRATPIDGGKSFAARGINDGAKNAASLKLDTDRHTVDRIAVSEIRRAVERVNDPEIGRMGLFDSSSFFGQDPVEREASPNMVDDALFRRMICIRHEVDRALVLDPEA
jgi:hypothetical protein